MEIYTIPQILEQGLLKSHKFDKPITTRTSVTRVWVKMNGSKVGKNLVLTKKQIDDWNNKKFNK